MLDENSEELWLLNGVVIFFPSEFGVVVVGFDFCSTVPLLSDFGVEFSGSVIMIGLVCEVSGLTELEEIPPTCGCVLASMILSCDLTEVEEIVAGDSESLTLFFDDARVGDTVVSPGCNGDSLEIAEFNVVLEI